MKNAKSLMVLLLALLFTIVSVSQILAQSANSQKPLTVEGEWEFISVNSDGLRPLRQEALNYTPG